MIENVDLATVRFWIFKTENNELIASNLECSVKSVEIMRELIRPTTSIIGKGKPRAVPIPATLKENDPTEENIDWSEVKQAEAMAAGSRKLLLKLLETGTHYLDKEAFLAICRKANVIHRVPASLLV